MNDKDMYASLAHAIVTMGVSIGIVLALAAIMELLKAWGVNDDGISLALNLALFVQLVCLYFLVFRITIKIPVNKEANDENSKMVLDHLRSSSNRQDRGFGSGRSLVRRILYRGHHQHAIGEDVPGNCR